VHQEESVGNTWVINMRHYDYPNEEAYRVTREAVRMAACFASIVEGTVTGSRLGGGTGVRCRRRPGRVPCSGVIQSELHPGGHELRWGCPVCEDNEVISNWAGTRWDPAPKAERYRSGELFGRQPSVSGPERSKHETIQGTITWDEGAEDGLPKIVTVEGKEYGWVELGKELMIHEGWPVNIELG
jgi:hypothetical protein